MEPSVLETNPTETVGPRAKSQLEREQEIERLAAEIGRLIYESEPQTREDLAQGATALLRDAGLRAGTHTLTATSTPNFDARGRALNPLAAGIGLLIVGAALALLLPFVGIALAGCGALAVLWGLAITWSKSR